MAMLSSARRSRRSWRSPTNFRATSIRAWAFTGRSTRSGRRRISRRAPEPSLGLAGAEGIAQARLSRITPLSRQALLLTSLEGFSSEDTGYLIGASPADVDSLVAEALAEIERQTHADVLIIEDEPIIAMDIETIVRDLGHNVTGVAVTRDEAVAQARQARRAWFSPTSSWPTTSSGIDAVKDILAEFSVPVIFITAFPERLLTGTRPEPTFLITKPFQRSTVKAAIAQALFFDAATVPAA